MATGEGKTLTAVLAASLWAWAGRPVHVITVNDYLVAPRRRGDGPGLQDAGPAASGTSSTRPRRTSGSTITAATSSTCTSKELVADFLRDQIALGNLRTSTQTSGRHADRAASAAGRLHGAGAVPRDRRRGRQPADRRSGHAADHLQLARRRAQRRRIYRAADELAQQLEFDRDFTIDRTVRRSISPPAARTGSKSCREGDGFWKGKRRREELVTQALTGRHCFIRDEQYLVDDDGKVQIIDEFTGRVMADRSWRHGLHQAIEVKESVTVTADKENLARLSFQRFFRQYPIMGGMTGTAWEAAAGAVADLPAAGRPHPHQPPVHPQAAADPHVRHDGPEVGRGRRARLRAARQGRPGAGRHAQRAGQRRSEPAADRPRAGRTACSTPRRPRRKPRSSPRPASKGKITVATNMAGRGTDIKLAKGVAELGGLHVISTEPHGSGRVDRQLFGRAARQGDPGCAQMFCQRRRRPVPPPRPEPAQSLARHRRQQADQAGPGQAPSASPASTASRCSRATTGWTRACRSKRNSKDVGRRHAIGRLLRLSRPRRHPGEGPPHRDRTHPVRVHPPSHRRSGSPNALRRSRWSRCTRHSFTTCTTVLWSRSITRTGSNGAGGCAEQPRRGTTSWTGCREGTGRGWRRTTAAERRRVSRVPSRGGRKGGGVTAVRSSLSYLLDEHVTPTLSSRDSEDRNRRWSSDGSASPVHRHWARLIPRSSSGTRTITSCPSPTTVNRCPLIWPAHLRLGRSVQGIFVLDIGLSLPHLAEDLVVVALASLPDEHQDQIKFLPLAIPKP